MTRILFVDDEPQVLASLQSHLTKRGVAWEMEFVTRADEALAALERAAFDAIVTDMQMPDMDGATLLQRVRDRWPDTVRVVLADHGDVDQSVRLAPVAHQYLSKPCDSRELQNTVERCLGLHSILRDPVLRTVVGKLGRLPPLPETYMRLQQAIAADKMSARELARMISSDTIISAKLLQMVNSSFFRLPRRITDVEHAVTYLGLAAVGHLVASAEVFSKWPSGAQTGCINFKQLQTHSVNVAAATHALATGMPFVNEAVVAALLHDIGYWVLWQQRPSLLDDAANLAAAEGVPMDVAERTILGATHSEIGAYLLGLWGFPHAVVEAVAHHHDPRRVQQTSFDALAALAVAHAMTTPTEASAFRAPLPAHTEVAASYLDAINAPFRWADAARRISTHLASRGRER